MIKAIIIKTREVLYVRFLGTIRKTAFYYDEYGYVYPEDALEFYEYYGG